MSVELIGRDAVLDRAREERAALDALLANMSDDEMCAASLTGGRSPKDILAHIAAWEARVVKAIEIGRTGETPPWPEPGFNPWDTDRLNERDFASNRDRSLAEVRAEARATHDRFMELARSFSEDEFANDLPYTPGIKLEQIIRGHADEHYREHREALTAARAGGAP